MADIVDKQTEKYLETLKRHFLAGGQAFDMPEPPNEKVQIRVAASFLQVAAFATDMLRTGDIKNGKPSREAVNDCVTAARSISELFRSDYVPEGDQ